jgi:hypothetical protein
LITINLMNKLMASVGAGSPSERVQPRQIPRQLAHLDRQRLVKQRLDLLARQTNMPTSDLAQLAGETLALRPTENPANPAISGANS